MATDDLSPAGSSTYSSDTMYVGDGTWDATKNDFLLPNLMGLNFETMRYNGMGNRFATMPGYKGLITAHGILAAITFLFMVPAAIMTVLLSTVVFTLGWMAVGPARSLTNPHHGIGLAIYVLIWVQFLSGWWTHDSEKKRVLRRIPFKAVLHQWIGRATALLAIAQVPLGLTLYGSPKYLFILFALWMAFLVLLYFILSYRALQALPDVLREGSRHGEVIQERRKSSIGAGILGPLLAGAGAAALLGNRDRNRSRSRSHSRVREEVIPSRRGSRSRRESVSYVEEEKFEARKKEGGGLMDTLFKGAAVLGAGALAKSFFDRRKRTNHEDEYSSVAPDTPGRRPHRRYDSEISDSTVTTEQTNRYEARRGSRPVLPGPRTPVAAAAAISAAEARPTTPKPVTPVTPRPVQSQAGRSHSFDSMSYSYDYGSGTTVSPSRRPQESNGLRNGLLAGLGVGWFAKKMKDRREKKEDERLEREEDEKYERERASRHINQGSHLTSDAFPPRTNLKRNSVESSELSSLVGPHPGPRVSVSAPPPIPVNMGQTRSHHDVVAEKVSMPPLPHDPRGILHPSSSDSDVTPTPGRNRRRSSIRREEGEAAAAAAIAGAAGLAAEEERRRQRSHSRSAVASPPVSVKVKVHGDKDRNVTLRRLTEQEAAAERASRRARGGQRGSRKDSISDLSDGEVSSRYRREAEKRAERRAESLVREKNEESGLPPPPMGPLTPPHPAFAGGKKPKDSGYYSGRPQSSGRPSSGRPDPSFAGGSVFDAGKSNMSEDTHGTWSAMSPESGTDHAKERRQRRRMERQRQNIGTGTAGTVDFS
ncbi:hypothetical protein SBOR_4498 [Sclerotinia borealis F-4128]|uniref:Cytochrome b561 domain-containing protein n=1 Tax=Sclerotinia borealis (strain F-4128) TaxID=1432307 RepID=W9CGY4_SCLBF|nr:hypothetical protein SBOR_4498 [Sclerotinia borealis F-4128]